MAVANDPELIKDFTVSNLKFMRKGEAPFPHQSEQVGGRQKFELHHIEHIEHGGRVYDLDNLSIMTPRQHIDLHSRRP